MPLTKSSLLNRLKRVLLLDQSVYKEVRDDEKAIIYGISIVMISGVFSSIGKVLVYFLPGISDIIIMPIFLVCLWVIVTYVTHFFAKAFGGQTTFRKFLTASGFSYTPIMFGIFPIIGEVIGTPWFLICSALALRSAHELTWGKTILVYFLTLFTLFIIFVIYFLVIPIF